MCMHCTGQRQNGRVAMKIIHSLNPHAQDLMEVAVALHLSRGEGCTAAAVAPQHYRLSGYWEMTKGMWDRAYVITITC